MTLNPLAVALQGIGFSVDLVAIQGLLVSENSAGAAPFTGFIANMGTMMGRM